MLAQAIGAIRSAKLALASALCATVAIELSPIADGEVRIINASRPVIGENGKPLREEPTAEFPKGKVVREVFPVEVAVSRSSQYRKAVKNRRAAARRVRMAERKFSLVASSLPAETVKQSLHSLYGTV